MSNVKVGIVAVDSIIRDLGERHDLVERVADGAADLISIGDHVSFRNGYGYDGLINATSLLSMHPDVEVHLGVYLLPLRHPVVVSRQLASIASLAPGRLSFGVGIGGEDRHEVEITGVDPSTRGKRMDECLQILRGLQDGEPFSFHGRFFSFDDAIIAPAPSPRIPMPIGGRSQIAVRRVTQYGDGWLGIWISPKRFAAVTQEIADAAPGAGRSNSEFEHSLSLWCGIADDRKRAREVLKKKMEDVYHVSFESFERYSPCGTPEDVAESLRPYIDAGASTFHVTPIAENREEAIEGVAEVKRLLTGG